MATIIYNPPMAPPNAATYAGADGDIWVSTLTSEQRRFSSTPTPVWTPIVPPETRADAVPRAGQLNDRLAKASNRAWDLAWANAADGVVTRPIAHGWADVWNIEHGLSFKFVDVTVLSPGGTDSVQMIEVPVIQYIDEMNCRLSFAVPVAGIAIVRR